MNPSAHVVVINRRLMLTVSIFYFLPHQSRLKIILPLSKCEQIRGKKHGQDEADDFTCERKMKKKGSR